MGNITRSASVFRFNIETGCRFLQACGEVGGSRLFGGTLEETLPVVVPMGGRGQGMGAWDGQGPGTEGEGVCEGKTRGAFWGPPVARDEDRNTYL